VDGEFGVNRRQFLAAAIGISTDFRVLTSQIVVLLKSACEIEKVYTAEKERLLIGLGKSFNWSELDREIRILESRIRIEAVADESIRFDMPSPNQRDEESQADIGPNPMALRTSDSVYA
jgi:hypothetical protein